MGVYFVFVGRGGVARAVGSGREIGIEQLDTPGEAVRPQGAQNAPRHGPATKRRAKYRAVFEKIVPAWDNCFTDAEQQFLHNILATVAPVKTGSSGETEINWNPLRV